MLLFRLAFKLSLEQYLCSLFSSYTHSAYSHTSYIHHSIAHTVLTPPLVSGLVLRGLQSEEAVDSRLVAFSLMVIGGQQWHDRCAQIVARWIS